MRAQTITSDALLDALSPLFDRTGTIKQRTDTRDAVGQPIPAWANLAGHIDLPCRVAPVTSLSRASRAPGPDMTTTRVTHVILLPDDYPSVTTAMQAVVGGATYQIVTVIRDSEQRMTELEVEVVTT